MSLPKPLAALGVGAGLTAVYFLAGRLGLEFALVHASASAVWAPTGIAIAACLLAGPRVWPAIFLGAFLVNVTTSGSVAASLGIATGNTLEALVAAWLAARYAGGRHAFERAGNLFRFAVAALGATTISATMGIVSLALAGLAQWQAAPMIWLTWWLGDLVGALVVTPLIVLWGVQPLERWPASARATAGKPGRRLAEALLVHAVVVGTGLAIFGGGLPLSTEHYPAAFLCIPPIIWAAFRFGPREAVSASFLLSIVAINGTLDGYGAFVRESLHDSLLILQAFLGTVTTMGLAVGALVGERRAAEEQTRRLNMELERRVLSRTLELHEANEALRREIAERRRAEDELARSEARLLEAQAVAHIGSWEWDVLRNRIWWSDELYRIYGLDRGSFEASYEGFLARVHPDDRDRVDQAVRRAAVDLQPFEFEHRVIRPDGSERMLFGRGRVAADAEGRPIRMAGTAQDITDRARAEEERAHRVQAEAARAQAEAASRLKDEFLAVVSHELRTPLTAILGWSRLLLRGLADEATARRAVETIERNARVQARLISDLLDMSSMIHGKLALDLRDVDPAAVVAAVADLMQPVAELKGVRLEVRVDTPPARIRADATRLEQVVSNLVSNSIKFTPSGGRVELGVSGGGGQLIIVVRDDGEGIASQFIPHLFERFRQADASTTRTRGGLGLGLAIARSLVEAHGGTLRAESAGPNRGSTFTVTLPVRSVAAGPELPPAAGSVPEGERPLAGVRVLVVDDEADARELMSTALERAGASVVNAASAAAAMAALHTERVDAMLVDIGMPGQDGFGLVRQVRAGAVPSAAGTPAAAVTAYARDEDARRARAEGFDGYLVKPFEPHALVAAVVELAGIPAANAERGMRNAESRMNAERGMRRNAEPDQG